jgi:hypothetical protein
MRLLDLLVRLGASRSWARGVLAYRVLQTIVVAERAPVRATARSRYRMP